VAPLNHLLLHENAPTRPETKLLIPIIKQEVSDSPFDGCVAGITRWAQSTARIGGGAAPFAIQQQHTIP
jgi:hypothetical protein